MSTQNQSVVQDSIDSFIDVLNTQAFAKDPIEDTREHAHTSNFSCHGRAHFQRNCNLTEKTRKEEREEKEKEKMRYDETTGIQGMPSQLWFRREYLYISLQTSMISILCKTVLEPTMLRNQDLLP